VLFPPIAHRQAGAFSRAQAREAGISRPTIIRRLADGRWRELVSDVFVVAGAPLTARTRAWAGHLTTGGVVAYRTAAALHGVGEEDDAIHVISRRELHVAAPGVIDHRTRLRAEDVEIRDGLPLTTRLRTVVDVLSTGDANQAQSYLFRAVQQGWLDKSTLEQQIAIRRGMTGNTRLREFAKLLGTGAHSVAERHLHSILEAMPGLVFRANAPIQVQGERFVVDVLLPEHRIVIEVDGRRFHSDADTFSRDRRRQNLLVVGGYVVLRFTWLDIVKSPRRVRHEILDAIAVSSVT
jgi:very-short-patch-repair endonuclease